MINFGFTTTYCSHSEGPKCGLKEYDIKVGQISDIEVEKFRRVFEKTAKILKYFPEYGFEDRIVKSIYFTTLMVFGGVKPGEIFLLNKQTRETAFCYKPFGLCRGEVNEVYFLIKYNMRGLKKFIESLSLKQTIVESQERVVYLDLRIDGEYEFDFIEAHGNEFEYKFKCPKICYELEKIYRKATRILRTNRNFSNPQNLFFYLIENRNKSHGYKKQNYCDNFYYTTVSGELGIIKSKGHNTGKVLGELLMRRGVIDKNTHQAKLELNGKRDTYWIKGTIIKHNRVLDDIKKSLTPEQYKYLSIYFDKAENCDMIIDKKFDIAYAPEYRAGAVYEGDLCSSSSCMSCRGDGQASSFYGKIPCCSVVRFERDGEQVGRCIMYEWKGKRHFIRIYGKPEYLPKMYKLLKAELKPGDLFGRQQCLNDLVERTNITDESTNMYLDGCYYGMVRSKDENDNAVYTMCTESTKQKVIEETDGCYSGMKSTSGETLGEIFEPEESNIVGTCDNCGVTIYEDDDEYIWIDDNLYCCSDCAHEAGYECCEKCGEWGWRDDGVSTDDAWYCCEECANRDGYYKCEVCGKWEYEGSLHEVYGMYDSVCDNCIDDLLKDGEIIKCDWCECYERTEDAYKMIRKDDRQEVYVCSDCHANSTYVQSHYDDIEETKEDEDVDKE